MYKLSSDFLGLYFLSYYGGLGESPAAGIWCIWCGIFDPHEPTQVSPLTNRVSHRARIEPGECRRQHFPISVSLQRDPVLLQCKSVFRAPYGPLPFNARDGKELAPNAGRVVLPGARH